MLVVIPAIMYIDLLVLPATYQDVHEHNHITVTGSVRSLPQP